MNNPPPPQKKETCRCYHKNVIYIQFLYIIFPSLSKILFTSRLKFYTTNAVKYKYPQHVPRRTTHSCYTVYDDFKLYWKDNGPFFIKFAFFKNEIKATEWNCVTILKTPLLAFLLKSLSVLHFINLVFCKIKNWFQYFLSIAHWSF